MEREQTSFQVKNQYEQIDCALEQHKAKKVLLVCGSSITSLQVYQHLNSQLFQSKFKLIRFSEFEPNPRYESVVKGVNVFRQGNCDTILAIGGGSAIDVAKCIKVFATMDPSQSYLQQEIQTNTIPLLVMPTTAGTGSEATRFAVIYENGVKQSVLHESCIPAVIFFDETTLEGLPIYQKKTTILDALCHGIESYWSRRATNTSRAYARESITLILQYMEQYLVGNVEVNDHIMKASYLAGKAIDLSQTTAAHAMSYKLTSLYGIAHGQAVAMCLPHIWEYMLEQADNELIQIFHEIADAMGDDCVENAIRHMGMILEQMEFEPIKVRSTKELEQLVESVNLARLQNNPIMLDTDTIQMIYETI